MKKDVQKLIGSLSVIRRLSIQLSPDIIRWVEAFASCAIEGNKEAKRMIDLWHSNKEQFLTELNRDWINGKGGEA